MAKKEEAAGVDDVESSAYASLKEALQGDDDEAGMTALKQFVVACVRREMAEGYEGE